MVTSQISAESLKLLQAKRALEAEKAAEKEKAKASKKRVVEAPVAETPKPPESPKKHRYIAHQIDTPADLLLAHRPDLKLYKWQAETLFQLAGYTDLNDLDLPKTRPIGKMVSHNVTANGIEATFKIANTMAGEDALVEATEGLRYGFSVGAQINEWTNNKGVMQITSATLDEVSLVTDPAIDSARVSEVAASENEAPKEDSDLATADSDTKNLAIKLVSTASNLLTMSNISVT